MSGDGADELFGGYNRYNAGLNAWRQLAKLPRTVRRAVELGLTRLPVAAIDRFVSSTASVLPARLRPFASGDKLHKLGALLAAEDPEAFYRLAVTCWLVPPLRFGDSSDAPAAWPLRGSQSREIAERMMMADLLGYLPDDVLVKVDRASMAVSLETRVPFLDHRVIEFSARMPLRQKIQHGRGKWLLRQVLRRYLPEKLFERPKMGFAVPIDSWLRGPLREWAESLIYGSALDNLHVLDAEAIRRCWRDHVVDGRQRQSQVWSALMFLAWHEATFA